MVGSPTTFTRRLIATMFVIALLVAAALVIFLMRDPGADHRDDMHVAAASEPVLGPHRRVESSRREAEAESEPSTSAPSAAADLPIDVGPTRTGLVVDETGAAVAGAKLRFAFVPYERPRRSVIEEARAPSKPIAVPLFETISDADGGFRAPTRAIAPNVVCSVSKPGYGIRFTVVDRVPSTAVVRIVLPRVPDMTGVVTTDDGTPVTGARVTFAARPTTHDDDVVMTDAEGRFRVRGCREWYRATAEAAGLPTTDVINSRNDVHWCDRIVMSAGRTLHVTFERGPRFEDPNLDETFDFCVVVPTEAGRRIVARGKIDETIDVPGIPEASSIRVLVDHPRWSVPSSDDTGNSRDTIGAGRAFTIPERGDVAVRVPITTGGHVTGKVVDRRGQPVGGVTIRAVPRGAWSGWGTPGQLQRTIAKEDGSFAFDHLVDAPILFFIESDTWCNAPVAWTRDRTVPLSVADRLISMVDLSENLGRAELRIVVAKTGTVRGKVMDDRGRPVKDAVVQCAWHPIDVRRAFAEGPLRRSDPVRAPEDPQDRNIPGSTTDAEGRFTIDHLGPFDGTKLLVRHPDFAWKIVECNVREADTTDLEIVMPSERTLRVRVLDPDDRPIEGVFVGIVRRDVVGPSARVTQWIATAADGTAILPHVTVGRWALEFASFPGAMRLDASALEEFAIDATGPDERIVRFHQPRTLSGTLVLEGGGGVRARMSIQGKDPSLSWASADSDASGAFSTTVTHVEPYTIAAIRELDDKNQWKNELTIVGEPPQLEVDRPVTIVVRRPE